MRNRVRDCQLEVKALSETGSFEGYGSVFDVTDHYGEVVKPGAFVESLADHRSKGRMPAMLWQHRADMPIGVYTDMHEDNKGLRVVGQLAMDTTPGKETYALLKLGAVSGLSIGYEILSWEEQDKTLQLTKLDLWEVSLVTFPANDAARIESVKAGLRAGETPTVRELENILRDAGFSHSQAKAICARGAAGLDPRDADAELVAALQHTLATMRQQDESKGAA